jgi:hypothetical protein
MKCVPPTLSPLGAWLVDTYQDNFFSTNLLFFYVPIHMCPIRISLLLCAFCVSHHPPHVDFILHPLALCPSISLRLNCFTFTLHFISRIAVTYSFTHPSPRFVTLLLLKIPRCKTELFHSISELHTLISTFFCFFWFEGSLLYSRKSPSFFPYKLCKLRRPRN